MSEGTKFSIVVVTYECAEAFTALVESMNAHLGADVELVVVDNDSSDDPEAVAQSWKGTGQFLRLGSNYGYGAAVNAGVEAATRDTVVVMNADTELLDGTLDRLAAAATRRGAMIGPRVLNADGSVQPSASGPPVGIWPWLRALIPAGMGPRWVVARLHPWRLSEEVEVAWVTGCCFAAPRGVLRSLGPFDPAIHMYGEDLDLGVRAGQAGVAVTFEPDSCRVIHHGKASSSNFFDDLGRAEAGLNGRAVLRRAFGRRRERFAWIAERVGVGLRSRVKRLLGRDASWERLVATGLRRARSAPVLRELPAEPPAPPAPVSLTRLGPPAP